MEELTNISYDSIIRYFKTLSTLGYKNYKEVERLIILLFIEELLDNMSEFITDEDYKEIIKGLECLYGSTCLIDIPNYDVYDNIIHKTVRQRFNARVSEDDIFRYSQDDMLRVKA